MKKKIVLLLLLAGCSESEPREGVVLRKAVGGYSVASHYVIDSTGARCSVEHQTWEEVNVGDSVVCYWRPQ